MTSNRTLLATIATLAILTGGCDTTAPLIEETTFAAALNIDLATMTKTASGLYYKDLVVGTGATAAAGTSVSVHYTGWFTNGTQFDSNQGSDPPFPFVVGTGAVIAGFDEGVIGIKAGGKRQLVVPPSLGYGSRRVESIPPNSILVFEVEVVTVQ